MKAVPPGVVTPQAAGRGCKRKLLDLTADHHVS